MADSILTRMRKAWNVFRYGEQQIYSSNLGVGQGVRPHATRMSYGNESSIVAPMYTRIGVDVSAMNFRHVRLDENEQFKDVITSGLNNCLTIEANKDQAARAFMQDVIMSLCDEGVVAIVPIDTSVGPNVTSSYDILSMRTAKITQWYTDHVQLNIYNDRTGFFQDITLPKKMVAIVENPLYAVMNEPNGTVKRLIEKLNLLDAIDRQSGSGKLDIIIQLPYVIKSQARLDQAEIRRRSIEEQLTDSQYGIAYIDGTERITQLNRPAENNLLAQIEYLTRMLHSQLGLTEAVFDGTAKEEENINYYNRTIEPMASAVADAMKRTFLTPTGRTQGQSVMALRDPFKLVAPSQLSEITDKFTRNEVLSPNEVRAIVGRKPSKDPKADELRNRNINEKVEKDEESAPMDKSTTVGQNGRSSKEHVKIKT